MIAVGIRELKSKLSEYVRLARAGEVVLVTDRGQVVAELRQPGRLPGDTLPQGLDELVRRGAARPGAEPVEGVYSRLDALISAADVLELLDAERGER